MKVLKWLDKNLEVLLSSCLLTVITVVMFAQVICRYVFNAPIYWAEELSRYCYIWITFITIGLTVRTGSYFRVTALIDLLPKKGRQFMEMLSHVINLAFYGVCFYYAIEILSTVFTSTQSAPALRIPMYVVYVILPIGMFLATFRSAQMLYLSAKSLVCKTPEETEG